MKMLVHLLAASLLVLGSESLSPEEGCDPEDSIVVAALEGFSGTLRCFKDVFHESLRGTKESNDNLRELVVELKGEIRNLRTSDDCDISKVKKLTQERDELKILLADKDEKIQELEQLLLSTKNQNEQHVLKVHALETMLKYSQQRKEEFAEQVNHLNNTVQELQTKLSSSLKQVEEMKGIVKILNDTVEPRDDKLKEECDLAKQRDVAKHVEEFSWSKDWGALSSGLESVMNIESTAYKQMQRVSGDHPMWAVGQGGYVNLATLLVCGGLPADANDPDRDGMLHGAASAGQVRAVAVLLDLGADVDARGSAGRTPLFWAADSGHLKLVQLLAARGAALNATANDGDAALHAAARGAYLTVVQYLVAMGADTTARGHRGDTAFEIAEANNRYAMATYLSQFPH